MWQLFCSTLTDENGETYKAYGVRGDGISISDLSTDEQLTQDFVDKLNRLEASAVHIYELAEDFLAQL